MKNITLNENNITLQEIELLEKLLRRVSDSYVGIELRNTLSEYEIGTLDNATRIVSDIVSEVRE